MDLHADAVEITAECVCKSHTISIKVSASKLPLQCNVCHCDSCRHSTGALFVIETTWPQARESVDINRLRRYQFSANITYRFCGTCSMLMFYESQRYPSKLGVFYGVLNNLDIDLIKLTKHIYVEDTLDGGASVWLRKPNADGREIPRYRGVSEDGKIPWDWPQGRSLTEPQGSPGKGTISIWCHCKGINLLLHLGNYNTKGSNSPTARFTVSDSCYPHPPNDIVHWAFADLADISQTDGSAFPGTTEQLKMAVDAGDSIVGTLAYYQSSSKAQRYFCRVCSASVFYSCSDSLEAVSVAVGLLEAPDGARAEAYLSWDFQDILAGNYDMAGGWRGRLMKRIQADIGEHRTVRN